MKIQYISNCIDADGIKYEGEIAVFFKDGKVVHHHDYSDGALEISYVESLLKSLGIDLEFEDISPTKKQVKEVNQYFKDQGII